MLGRLALKEGDGANEQNKQFPFSIKIVFFHAYSTDIAKICKRYDIWLSKTEIVFFTYRIILHIIFH